MKVLHLTIKRQWFDLIQSGEKPEEYREYNHYWVRRLFKQQPMPEFKDFDTVQFYNGWACSTKYPNFKIQCKGIEIREGKTEWGAEPGEKYFVIKLGEKLKG